MNKEKELLKVSNPVKVYNNMIKYFGKDTNLYYSTRKDKKYMILNPNTNKFIHFGSMNYEDYTKHNDEKRRDNFLRRNIRWKNQNKYTSGYMSYFLLW